MHSKLRVLIASRSKPALMELAGALASRGAYRIDARHIENGHADPLWGLDFTPDVVVMLLNDQGHHDLAALGEVQSDTRPPLIVLAKAVDTQTMRLAMQAGARDFLQGAVTLEDLIASIDRVSVQFVRKSSEQSSALTVFVNAKGGSGATFLACNVAHMLTTVSGHTTALVSLDMQFEGLAQYFDTKLRHGLMQALESVDDLDAVALDAYMTQHESGLRLLAPQPESAIQEGGAKAAELGQLLDKMSAHYGHTIVDMPRRLDAHALQVLQRASRIVLVVQQTLSHMRDAARMLQLFSAHGVRKERVLVVVNRCEKNAAIGLDDIKRALHGAEVVVVPSDYKLVAESINLGVPMYEHARTSAVTKALVALETELGGSSAKTEKGFIGKALSNLLRKESWSQT